MDDEQELGTGPAEETQQEAAADDARADDWALEDEDDARAFGWKPRDNWKGEIPDGFVDDPRDFMKRIASTRPYRVMAERMDKAERDHAAVVAGMERVSRHMAERTKADADARVAEIVAQQRAAAVEADPDKFDALEKERQKAVQERDAATTQAAAQPEVIAAPGVPQVNDPGVQRRLNDAKWARNPALVAQAQQMLQGRPDIASSKSNAEQVDWVEAELRLMHPQYFAEAPAAQEQPAPRPAQNTVDPGGLAHGKASGFDRLPADARRYFHTFFENGDYGNKTIEDAKREYVDVYHNG